MIRKLMMGAIAAGLAGSAAPAWAQMCGGAGAQQAGSSSMCGSMASQPNAEGSEQAAGPAKSGCGCCQNMAMMQTPMQGQDADGGQAPPPMMDIPSPDAPQSMPQQ